MDIPQAALRLAPAVSVGLLGTKAISSKKQFQLNPLQFGLTKKVWNTELTGWKKVAYRMAVLVPTILAIIADLAISATYGMARMMLKNLITLFKKEETPKASKIHDAIKILAKYLFPVALVAGGATYISYSQGSIHQKALDIGQKALDIAQSKIKFLK